MTYTVTQVENSVREAEEHNSLVKNLKKKKIKMGP